MEDNLKISKNQVGTLLSISQSKSQHFSDAMIVDLEKTTQKNNDALDKTEVECFGSIDVVKKEKSNFKYLFTEPEKGIP